MLTNKQNIEQFDKQVKGPLRRCWTAKMGLTSSFSVHVSELKAQGELTEKQLYTDEV